MITIEEEVHVGHLVCGSNAVFPDGLLGGLNLGALLFVEPQPLEAEPQHEGVTVRIRRRHLTQPALDLGDLPDHRSHEMRIACDARVAGEAHVVVSVELLDLAVKLLQRDHRKS